LTKEIQLGRTALVHGAEAGQAEVVEMLANKGADLSLTDWKTEDQLKAALRTTLPTESGDQWQHQ